jgi:two-component system response regulator HydG
LGETGTGKEMIATAIHRLSNRTSGPFVRVNCGALSESLLESELFGHVRGSFTGAVNNRTGRFEAAHTGTIFLDEIGEMSPRFQVKLLRVLEDGTFDPVGSAASRHTDVRVIAATHRDLHAGARQGTFREDLLYRLDVVRIHLPALRERREDSPLIARHFLRQNAARAGQPPAGLPVETAKVLMAYDWPGNVRELRNVVNRAFIMARGDALTAECLPDKYLGSRRKRTNNSVTLPLGQPMEEVERIVIEETLNMTAGDKKKTAEILGISSKTLYNKMKKYKQDEGEEEEETDEE